MSSLSSYFRKAPGLRLRPLPEWRALIVYTPQRPDLHWLNPEAWMVLELADGDIDKIAETYAREAGVETPAEARQIVSSCLQTLEKKGIVERVDMAQ